jgi:hypothetical protein
MKELMEMASRDLNPANALVLENGELFLKTRTAHFKFDGFYYPSNNEWVKSPLTLDEFVVWTDNKLWSGTRWSKAVRIDTNILSAEYREAQGYDARIRFNWYYGSSDVNNEAYPDAFELLKSPDGNRLEMHFKVIWEKEEVTWTNSENCEHVILDSGDFLLKHYGKYKSGLGIIVPKNSAQVDAEKRYIKLFRAEDRISYDDLNLGGKGQLDVVRGDYFVSKKGTKLFKLNPMGKHYLLKDEWGGAFNNYRGGKLPTTDRGAVYYRCASSNGGGCGNDFSVIPIDWKNTLSEEDL